MPSDSASASSTTAWSFTASPSAGTAKRRTSSSPVRAAGRALLLILLLLGCLPPHLISKALWKQSLWPRRFLRGAAWICGLRINVVGEPLKPHSLLICNHVSWLDILTLGAATGTAFVSKDELRDHALLRWLGDQNQTLYVERSRRKETPAQAAAIAEALHDPQPLAIFPEGTVGPGDRLLPFRSALLSAVTPPPRDVDVRPVAIDYGEATPEISWVGETGKQNFIRVLGRKGSLRVNLHLLPAITHREDRKALAQEARESIAQTLASSRGGPPLYAAAK